MLSVCHFYSLCYEKGHVYSLRYERGYFTHCATKKRRVYKKRHCGTKYCILRLSKKTWTNCCERCFSWQLKWKTDVCYVKQWIFPQKSDFQLLIKPSDLKIASTKIGEKISRFVQKKNTGVYSKMTQTLLTDDFCLRSCWREHHPWILLQLKVAKRYSLLEQKTKQTLLTTLICKLTVSQTVWVDDLSHNKKKQLPKSVCKKTTPSNMWPNTVDSDICLEKAQLMIFA